MKNVFSPLLILVGCLILSACATTQLAETSDNGQQESTIIGTTKTTTVSTTSASSNEGRQVANSIQDEIPRSFYQAASAGTRTMSGKPGENYWQQRARYEIDAELNPADTTLNGLGTITYYNNSPDTLGQLFLELTQNVHKEGVPRNEATEITGGINLHQVRYQGEDMDVIRRRGQSGYIVDGTIMLVLPSRPIMPGDSVKLEVGWDFKIPQRGAGERMGYSEDNLFFLAYWYPQMRVYDDVIGWFTDPFLLNAEFYHDFANYDVRITVPEQWIVTATGRLTNAEAVLSDGVADRLMRAMNSDEVVNVVSENDFGNVTQSGADGTVTWHYQAKDVRDFAFSATKASIWDAARTPVGDRDGDGKTDYTQINALYRSSAPLWKDAAAYGQHSISFLSEYTGVAYPWPHMSSIEGGGIIGGGMEFPMMTLIGDYRGQPTESLYAVIAHELAHMWVPMQISTNERRYSWMDEGTTTFNENQAKREKFPEGPDYDLQEFQRYLQLAGSEYEGEIMRWSDYHYNQFAYSVASYPKPGSLLSVLRAMLGEETFNAALQRFMNDWQYKHPYPWDLFNTFEDVAGRDLDWFWRSWYYETWTLDQAVAEVTPTTNGARILIQDLGQVPMPSKVVMTLSDGSTITRSIDVSTWLGGATSAILEVDLENGTTLTRVEIDPEFRFPDADRSNNFWQKP